MISSFSCSSLKGKKNQTKNNSASDYKAGP